MCGTSCGREIGVNDSTGVLAADKIKTLNNLISKKHLIG
jgi:hypothetical protein